MDLGEFLVDLGVLRGFMELRLLQDMGNLCDFWGLGLGLHGSRNQDLTGWAPHGTCGASRDCGTWTSGA